MSKYTSETKRAIFMIVYRINAPTCDMEAKFKSIAAAWRFLSGYDPMHYAWVGKNVKKKETTYDALQAMLKRDGCMHVNLMIDGISHQAYLEYVK